MNKTVKVALISVISTIAVIALLVAILIPVGIDGVKSKLGNDYGNEAQLAETFLNDSKSAAFQTNYIITGLVMSPEFMQYLQDGVTKGWWTEEYLAQFTLDEILPILFDHYRILFGAIVSGDGVQGAIGTIKDLKRILANNKDTITHLLSILSIVMANKDTLAQLVEKIENIISTLKSKMKDVDPDWDFNNVYKLVPGKVELDLSQYAALLNVLNIEIPTVDDVNTVYDKSTCSVSINTVYAGFEVDGEPTYNILGDKSIDINDIGALTGLGCNAGTKPLIKGGINTVVTKLSEDI